MYPMLFLVLPPHGLPAILLKNGPGRYEDDVIGWSAATVAPKAHQWVASQVKNEARSGIGGGRWPMISTMRLSNALQIDFITLHTFATHTDRPDWVFGQLDSGSSKFPPKWMAGVIIRR